MKTRLVFVGLLLAVAVARPQDESHPDGAIYGTVVDQHGEPAKGISLLAWPDMPLGTRLPAAKSNHAGEYRFEHLPWWGKYGVAAEDPAAGYSMFATGGGRNDPPGVELTPQHPEAEMKVYLPAKAGFVYIHLTNRRTGAPISGMYVAVVAREKGNAGPYWSSCESTKAVLVPPDTDLLLHVKSDGYREWKKSARRGKPIRLSSGAQLTLDVQLEPME